MGEKRSSISAVFGKYLCIYVHIYLNTTIKYRLFVWFYVFMYKIKVILLYFKYKPSIFAVLFFIPSAAIYRFLIKSAIIA